jgi:uncharacterized membrane protein YdbT with pleckstrin-like domain
MFDLKQPDEVDWFEPVSDEEEIYKWQNPSKITVVPETIAAIVFSIIMVFVVFSYYGTMDGYLIYGLLLIPVAFMYPLAEYIKLSYTYHILTSHEVVKKTGILSTETSSYSYDNIQNQDFTRNAKERILTWLGIVDIGDVEVFTAGTDGSELYMDNVKGPEDFISKIKERRFESD